jgi:hypothetical protein
VKFTLYPSDRDSYITHTYHIIHVLYNILLLWKRNIAWNLQRSSQSVIVHVNFNSVVKEVSEALFSYGRCPYLVAYSDSKDPTHEFRCWSCCDDMIQLKCWMHVKWENQSVIVITNIAFSAVGWYAEPNQQASILLSLQTTARGGGSRPDSERSCRRFNGSPSPPIAIQWGEGEVWFSPVCVLGHV